MRSFFSKSRYSLASHIAIWSALVHFSTTDYCYTQNMYGSFLGAISSSPQDDDETKYTINFNNVSVIEVIRFASKITGSNFIFAENDLQFNVTIVSEEPISAKNFLSALIQVLRINGMKLLEQEGNFLITSSASDVNQIPTIVTGDIPSSLKTSAPIVTRIFRIKNARISSLVGIVKPLTSKSSLIEVSEQTKQLIITDITTNIDKIAILLQTLDTPHSNFEIESYTAKNIYPPDIISLTKQILEPFLEGTPLLFVPQIEANTIFIISTPHLIERALAVMEDIDVPAQLQTIGTGSNAHNSIFFVYPIQKGSAKQIRASLSNLALKAKDINLQTAIETSQWIQETNSLVFMIPPALTQNLQTLLAALDTPNSNSETQIYCYKILHAKESQIEDALKQMAATFKDPAFSNVIQNLKWIQDSNTLVFSGSPEVIAKLSPILAALDVPNSKDNIYIYQIQHLPKAQLEDALQKTMENVQDPELINTIKNVKWIQDSNQLIFNGPPSVIAKLREILPTLDIAGASTQTYMYTLEHASKKQISASLQMLASTTQNKELSNAIKELKWLDNSNTLIFRAKPAVINQLQTMLTMLDTAGPELELYMYKVRNTPKNQVLDKLKQLSSTIQDKALLEAIENTTLIPESNTLIFHTTPATNKTLQKILETLDVKDQEFQIYMYKAQNAPRKQIVASLEQLADTIKNKELSDAVKQMKWIEESKTFMFHAAPSAIDQLQKILPSLDVADSELQLYTVKIEHTQKKKIMDSLDHLASTINNKDLSDAIKNMEWIEESKTLLFRATPSAVAQLKTLIPTLDAEGSEVQLYMYKLQNASSEQMTTRLSQLSNTIQDKELVEVIKSTTFIPESETLTYHANSALSKQFQSILSSLDVKGAELQLHTYKIKNVSIEQITSELDNMIGTIKDKELSTAIKTITSIPESNILLFNAKPATYTKLENLLSSLDIKGEELQFYTYKILHAPKDQLLAKIKNMESTIQDKELSKAVKNVSLIPDSNTLMFHATPAANTKLQGILLTLDVADPELQLYMFKVQNVSKKQITNSLERLAGIIKNKDLSNAITQMKWIDESSTLMFHASPSIIDQLQAIIPTLDVSGPDLTLYSYKIRGASNEQIMDRLQQITSTLQDKTLVSVIKTITLIPESDTLVFNTTSAINTKIQNILSTIDVKGKELLLYVYKIEHVSKKQMSSSLEQLASTMQNKDFSTAVAQVKWVEDSHSFIFHTTPATIEQLQLILPTLDTENAQLQIYSYTIKNTSPEQITTRLKQVTSTIQDKELLDAINSSSLIPESNTLLFSATPKANTKLQNLLTTLDVKGQESHVYIYKTQHVSSQQIIEKLKKITNTIQNKDLLAAINSIVITNGNNTLSFQATSLAGTELQNLLATLDSTGLELQLYMYKVLHASQKQLSSSLSKISSTIQDKELSDAINQMQWIPEKNTIMFHATPSVIDQLKKILETLDAADPELQPYTYTIRNAEKEQVLSSLDKMASTSQNKELSTAILGAALIPGSNTLIFYATPAINTQIQNILGTLDVVGQQLYMYPIKNTTYKQISASLEQLTDSLQNKDLSDAVKNMKWVEKSNTLMFNANADTQSKLQAILTTLDAGGPNLGLHLYKIQNGSKEHIMEKLKQLTATIQDKELLVAIQGATLIPESNTLIFHATPSINEQIQNILTSLDAPDSQLQVYMYKIQHLSQEQITSSLKQLAATVKNKDLSNAIEQMRWIEKSNTLMFNASPSIIAQLQDILTTLDATGPEQQLFIYKILNAQKSDLLSRLKQMTGTIQDKHLLDAIQGASILPDSNSLLFSTTPATYTKLQNILSTLDVAGLQLYMYKIQNLPKDQLISSLNKISSSLQNKDLSDAIEQLKWIQESNTLMFHATLSAIDKLQTLLPSLDVKATENHFLLYNPKNQTGEELQNNLTELSQSLAGSGLQNTPLLNALHSMKWVASSNSLIFTGDTASTDRILVILQNLDVPLVNNTPFSVFVYKPTHASQQQLKTALTFYAQNLNPAIASDQQLIQAISSAEWIPETLSFLFKSNANTWTALQKILISLDNSKSFANTQTNTFYLYKLQKIPGNILIQDLKTLSDSLPKEDQESALLITTIQGLKWVKENNSVLITGSPSSIDKIKNIIIDFDTNFQSLETPVSPKSEFFIYKHQNLSAEEIQTSLKNLAQDLASSSLANPDLIHTLQTVSIVSSTGSLLFTGTVDSLAKVKTLLLTIDTKEPSPTQIQSLGSTVFLIYKIKQTPAEALIQSLQTFGSQLSQADVEDKALEQSLSSVKWIKETNSLLFTGPQSALEKAEKLAEKFDLGTATEAPAATSSTFVVYSPLYLTGEALITILSEFKQHLIQSKVSDPELFDSIQNLRFIDKTNSLIISGTPASIQKIQELLVKFDKEGGENSSISSIDASSFLIYKLQYHPGFEILEALKKVASSLSNSAPEANKALIDAVDSLQWLEVTNSLLGTGTPEILGKIKELILNLDVPLRQVFIEVLVVETSLYNSQNFGLQWGSQLQYLNKTIGAIGNFPTTVSNFTNGGGNTPPGTINMANAINNTTNLNTPVQNNPNINSQFSTAVPFSTGFDLGVIGDILFHKGQSFISLGSLLNALQVDNDTTVVMNPKLITQDGHTSNIFVGQNIPFVGSFVSNTASNTVQSSNIEYRDVGVNLTITPTLGTNNVITLDINQDISEQTNNTTSIQGSQVTGIQTNHTTMNTRVHVPDRHFLVLSGMIQDTKTHFRSGIPCLGGLPVIGALFAENDRLNTKANIIIFLRPFIIDSFEDYDNITAAEEDLYKERAGLQCLKEEFDAGTEMIKDLNND